MIHHAKHHQIDSLFLYGLAVLSVILLSNISKPLILLQSKLSTVIEKKVEKSIENKQLFNGNAFTDVKIRGKAYVVYDIVNGTVIAGENATSTLPLASLTKIMTALTAYTHYNKNKHIVITPASIDGAYDLGLKNGQVWSLDELLKYTLVFSSNDGAQAIADNLGGRNNFVVQMNNDARSWGFNLQFTQPAGLDENGKIGGRGSALDVARLFVLARKQFPQILDATTKRRVTVIASNGKISGIPNTNQDIPNISGAEGSKTGFTDLAGGNLVIVTDVTIGHPVVIVVLGSTREGRFADMEMLYRALQESIKK